MATTRIKDISTTATQAASDDYLALDGTTNGTRKILAGDLGGSTLVIEVSGTKYEVTGLVAATVSGVSGIYVYYDDGTNGSIFIPDGVGMNNVKQAIETEIPTKTSDLANDSGFLTSAVTSFNGQSGAVTYAAPVSSVNGQTGAVTISNATTSAAGLMSADDKTHLEAVYADYSSAITALGA